MRALNFSKLSIISLLNSSKGLCEEPFEGNYFLRNGWDDR